ncbi:hypothetical protein VNI00_014914, partial [Paramarasmius palmivorus]
KQDVTKIWTTIGLWKTKIAKQMIAEVYRDIHEREGTIESEQKKQDSMYMTTDRQEAEPTKKKLARQFVDERKK